MSRSLLPVLLTAAVSCGDAPLPPGGEALAGPEAAPAPALLASPVPASANRGRTARAPKVAGVSGEDEAPEQEPAETPDCAGILEQPPGKTVHPIVLVHGMGGFDEIGPLDYFYGVPELLRNAGYEVHVALTDPFNGSDVRAGQLALYVDRVLACTGHPRVNLVAHSQGGIDARWLVHGLGYADRVASVTTLATPHRGTPIADIVLGLVEGPQVEIADTLADVLGLLWPAPEEGADVTAALWSVSQAGTAALQDLWPEDPAVPWYSWTGVSGIFTDPDLACLGAEVPPPSRGDLVHPVLAPTFLALGGGTVPNDGLVPVESARWGVFRGCIAADHMDEVGQLAGLTDGFDHEAFYLDLAAFLAAEGF